MSDWLENSFMTLNQQAEVNDILAELRHIRSRHPKMAIDDGFVYEINENGERVVVKSIESVSIAYLRFTNRTSRPIEIFWRDFDGKRRPYTCLEPGAFYDINSYLTHPWEFKDRVTKESYVINNKPIFRAPTNLGNKRYRTNWNITVGVRTLKHAAMLFLASVIPDEEIAYELGLPQALEDELVDTVTLLKRGPQER